MQENTTHFKNQLGKVITLRQKGDNYFDTENNLVRYNSEKETVRIGLATYKKVSEEESRILRLRQGLSEDLAYLATVVNQLSEEDITKFRQVIKDFTHL